MNLFKFLEDKRLRHAVTCCTDYITVFQTGYDEGILA